MSASFLSLASLPAVFALRSYVRDAMVESLLGKAMK